MSIKRLFLFHNDCPKGKLYAVSEEDIAELNESGWVESPRELDSYQESKAVGVTIEQAKEADPQALVNLVKSLGFHVLTDEMLQAEINKGIALSVSKGVEVDEGSGLHGGDGNGNIEYSLYELQDLFNDDAKSLTTKELVRLGNEKYTLGLRTNMKDETLIEKIINEMNEAE